MAFNVTPKDAPSITNPAGATAKDSRARAIEAFTKAASPQAQETPVQNPTQVAPEEMTAIKASSSESSEVAETAVQKDTDSDTAKASEETRAKEESPLSSQYALMARKEKAIRAKQQELKAQEDALKAREESIKSEYNSKYVPKERLTQDTLSVLNELGISYEQLTNLVLNNSNATPESAEALAIKELKAEVKRLNDAQETSKKSLEEQQQNSYKQAVNQIHQDVKKLVTSEAERFETISATDSTRDVVELIERTFKEDGILMSVEEACMEVEQYMEEETLRLAQLKKIQAKLRPSQVAEKQQEVKKEQQQQPMKTLTNSMTSTKPMSVREKAILAFQGKLPK